MPSTTRLLVLGAVKIFQPVHGYDVRRELLSWRADRWANVAPGSIYNQLKTLTRDAMLEIVGTEQHSGRPARTMYRLTADGETEFFTLLRQAWWTVGDDPYGIMAGLSFVFWMRRDEIIAALEHRITALEGLRRSMAFSLEELQRPRASPFPPDHVAEMWHLTDARMAGEIRWAGELIGRLRSGAYVTLDDGPAEDRQAEGPC